MKHDVTRHFTQERNHGKSLILSIVLAVATLGAGYWLGKRSTNSPASPNATETSRLEVSDSQTPALPPQNAHGENSSTAVNSRKLSLSEIEEQIRGLNGNMGRYGSDRKFMKVLDSVDVADIPQLLAFKDKNTQRNVRQGLRYTLVSRWAESDLQGALTYVEAIPNRLEREAAFDAQAAATWVKQFPAGQLRNPLISQVSSVLAATDPQAALAMSAGSPNNGRHSSAAYGVFSQWAYTNPAEAAARAGSPMCG